MEDGLYTILLFVVTKAMAIFYEDFNTSYLVSVINRPSLVNVIDISHTKVFGFNLTVEY